MHLLHEIDLYGPVQTRTMSPIECYSNVLKNFVKKKARPEGSMLQGYMLFKSTVYLTKLCKELNIEGLRLWDSKEIENVEGHVLRGLAKTREIKGD